MDTTILATSLKYNIMARKRYIEYTEITVGSECDQSEIKEKVHIKPKFGGFLVTTHGSYVLFTRYKVLFLLEHLYLTHTHYHLHQICQERLLQSPLEQW
jgi:hypothetical protein